MRPGRAANAYIRPWRAYARMQALRASRHAHSLYRTLGLALPDGRALRLTVRGAVPQACVAASLHVTLPTAGGNRVFELETCTEVAHLFAVDAPLTDFLVADFEPYLQLQELRYTHLVAALFDARMLEPAARVVALDERQSTLTLHVHALMCNGPGQPPFAREHILFRVRLHAID